MSAGRIEIILGSMFSGKSTELIRQHKRYKVINKKVLVIKYHIDKRYDSGNKISTHDKQQIECLSLEKLEHLYDSSEFKEADVIIIEEAQFFEDLFNFSTNSADKYGKIVIVAGLDGDFKRNPFGDILKLIPHAEKVSKLSALCTICGDGTKASFTKRIVCSNEITLIGGTNEYLAVCRNCYLK